MEPPHELDAGERMVLVTGASGLLGRAVLQTFVNAGWNVVGLAFSRAHLNKNLVKVDICDHCAVEEIVTRVKPNAVVHCAAEKSPDVVEQKPDEAYKINVEATSNISRCSKQIGALYIYISTDYVFDGTKPPYKEDATPTPINKYGESKLAGETASFAVNPDAVVLRVPVLYGEVDTLSESAVTVLFEKLLNGPTAKPSLVSHYERRYPTHVRDIAHAVLVLAEGRGEGQDIRGIYHWSGIDCLTKYEMMVQMSQIFGLPMDHIVPDTSKPVGGTARPYDSALSCERLQKFSPDVPVRFTTGIQEVLRPFAR